MIASWAHHQQSCHLQHHHIGKNERGQSASVYVRIAPLGSREDNVQAAEAPPRRQKSEEKRAPSHLRYVRSQQGEKSYGLAPEQFISRSSMLSMGLKII
jgi:hypothetical protein